MNYDNEKYVYIEDLADTLGMYAFVLEQIFVEIGFIDIVNGENILINEGLEYGTEYFGYTNFKSSVLKHHLVIEAVNRHFKALEERPEKEKYNKSLFVKHLKEEGYTIKDSDSMDIVVVKEDETMKLEFQKSDEKIVSTSFNWNEVGEEL